MGSVIVITFFFCYSIEESCIAKLGIFCERSVKHKRRLIIVMITSKNIIIHQDNHKFFINIIILIVNHKFFTSSNLSKHIYFDSL